MVMITEAAVPTKQKKMPDWSAIRDDFPILDQKVHGQPLIYFDNAATTQKPRAVLDALRHYYEHDNARRTAVVPLLHRRHDDATEYDPLAEHKHEQRGNCGDDEAGHPD